MRNPFRRRGVKPSPEATAARKRAAEELADARSETPAYMYLAESLRDLRERNHFAENIAASFRGGPPR